MPLLVAALGFPTHVATATSHFVLAIMALLAIFTRVLAGTFHHGAGLQRAAPLSVGWCSELNSAPGSHSA